MIASQELEYSFHYEGRIRLSRMNPCRENDGFLLFMMIEVLIHHRAHLHAFASEYIAARGSSLSANTR